MKILVTGSSGFIGMHVALELLNRGDTVVGLDNMNDYYEVSLKESRLSQLRAFKNFQFIHEDLANRVAIEQIFSQGQFDGVIHLAAQAGVRYSLKNPQSYIDSNLVGFGNILEGARHHAIRHLVYASSSSVYGGNTEVPFAETDRVDYPVSLYAATKRANELMAHTYSHLFGLPTTGLRFFTVYGPWGRPDMSPFLFTRAILNRQAIQVFNQGDMMRDFTYIDDIVRGVIRCFDKPPTDSQALVDSPVLQAGTKQQTPYRLFNIGNHQPVQLLDYIAELEKAWGMTTDKELLPMQAGDVQRTMADTDRLEAWVDYRPNTPLSVGIHKFVQWYRDYYQIN